MADKELRKMNRTELIEIIYALQQNQQTLETENRGLKDRLEDRMLRIGNSGSIAEAALSLNHIFEDAQAAAEEYLMSVQDVDGQAEQILANANSRAEAILAEARAQADAMTAEAQSREDMTEAEARVRTDETAAIAWEQAEKNISGDQAEKDIRDETADYQQEAALIIDKARQEAAQILADAKAEAEKATELMQQAQEEYADAKRKKQAVDRYKDAFIQSAVKLVKQHPELRPALKKS